MNIKYHWENQHGKKNTFLPIEVLQFILNPNDLLKNKIDIYGMDEKLGVVVDLNLLLELYKDSISKSICTLF